MEYDGYWRARVTARLKEINRRSLRSRDALSVLCWAIVNRLPDAPASVERDNLYRVDINLLGQEKNAEPIFPFHLPVVVRDGDCQLKPENMEYYLTYPGDLADWELQHGEWNHDTASLEIEFIALDNQVDDLDLLAACEAFLDDPAHLPQALNDAYSGFEMSQVRELRVTATRRYGNPLLNFSTGKGADFVVDGQVCVPVVAGEQT